MGQISGDIILILLFVVDQAFPDAEFAQSKLQVTRQYFHRLQVGRQKVLANHAASSAGIADNKRTAEVDSNRLLAVSRG